METFSQYIAEGLHQLVPGSRWQIDNLGNLAQVVYADNKEVEYFNASSLARFGPAMTLRKKMPTKKFLKLAKTYDMKYGTRMAPGYK